MQDKNTSSDDFITLSGIKGRLADLLRFFIRAIEFFFAILFRNKILILTGLILGLLLGYFYYASKKNTYRISMIMEFTELNKKTFAEMFTQLNSLVLTRSHEKLAKLLQVSLPVSKSVGFMETQNLNSEPLSKDTSTLTGQTFKVIVNVSNNTFSDTLEVALARYLNNNPYLHHLKEAQKNIYTQKLAYIESELSKLDSLKSEYNRFLATSKMSSTIYNNAFNPAEIYVQSNNLANQKEGIQRWLAFNGAAVTVVDGFKTLEHPSSLSLFRTLLLFGFSGVLFALLLGMFREMKRMLIG